MPEQAKKKPPRHEDPVLHEDVDVEYVYVDEQGDPIQVPLGTYRPEDFEEEVIEVESDEEAASVRSGASANPVSAPAAAPAPVKRREAPAAGGRQPAAEAEKPLELRGVWRGFRSGGGRVEVLKDVTMHLSAGELVVVAGPSGSGKSTLLSVTGGLLRADRGEVLVFGEDLTEMSESGMQAVRRAEIGFIFQNVYLMAALPAVENVRIAMDIKGRGPRNLRSEMELLEMVGMAEYARRLPRALSGGQCQRVAVARALAGGPRVILADEPTASLDTENALAVMDLLRRLTREERLATAVVTHDVRLFQYADRVLSLDGGRLREVRKHDGK